MINYILRDIKYQSNFSPISIKIDSHVESLTQRYSIMFYSTMDNRLEGCVVCPLLLQL